jgi:hypothetical protein
MEIGFVKKAKKTTTTMSHTFKEINNRNVLARLILIIFGIFSITVLLSACSNHRTFSSNIKEFDFTFEIPEGWAIDSIQNGSELIEVNTSGPIASERESSAKASFVVFLLSDPTVDRESRERVAKLMGYDSWADQEAQNNLSGHVEGAKNSFHNFNLLNQGDRLVDGVKGYGTEYTYDFPNPWPVNGSWIVIPTRNLYIEVPRNRIVYEILISASQDEWNAREKDIQHILDTFKWK